MNSRKKTTFVKQAAILAIAGILVRILGFAYRLPLTNMIGDEGNGIYSAGYNLYNMFLVISSAGLPAAISKMVSEKITLGQYKNAKKIFNVSLIVAGLAGLACAVLMFFGAEWFCSIIKSPRSYYSILTLSPTIFIVAVMSVFRGYFQGMNTTVPTAISQIVEQIFNAFFSVYLAWILIDRGVEFGAAGGTAGTGIGALAGLIFISFTFFRSNKTINEEFKADKNNYKINTFKEITITLIKTAVPIITGTAIFSMTNLIDMKMVNSRLAACGAFTENEIDALYGQLTGKYVTLTTLPVSISTALATAVLPSIASSMVKKEMDVVKSKIATTLRLTMIISVPAAIGIGILGDQILQLLFPRYAGGGILLKVGSISIIFLALSQIATGILQGIGKMKVPAINALIGSLLKIPVNYFLIGIASINVVGAVISTTVCYVAASGLNLLALYKATGIKTDLKSVLIKPILGSVIMGVICLGAYYLLFYIYPSNTVATLFAILVAIFAYFLAMIVIRGFERDDLKLMPMGNKIISFLDKKGLL